MVIVEYCEYGNLHDFLQKYRKYFIDQIIRESDYDIIDRNIRLRESLVKNFYRKLASNEQLNRLTDGNVNVSQPNNTKSINRLNESNELNQSSSNNYTQSPAGW